MPREYRTIEEAAGPLLLVKNVENVTYGELAEIRLANGEKRRCRVLEIDGSNALVQLFENAAGINAGIAQNRYEAAMNTSNIIQAVQADGNATRQMIQQDKIESLQQKVAALENGMQTAQLQSDIAAATANTIRWPNQWTYGAGMPPIWNTCGCGQYNM